MAAPMLRLDGIEKSFPGVRALRGVGFDVRAGEVHALLGENGAGKSHPDQGDVRRASPRRRHARSPHRGRGDVRQPGRRPRGRSCHDLPGAAVVPGTDRGRKRVHGPRTQNAVRRAGLGASGLRATALLASLDIHDLDVNAVVGTLSVGNRQRVEILRALSQDARLLIMDEPTAALTEHDVKRLFDIVRRLRARNVGIVYISHRMDEIFALADRVTVLRDGPPWSANATWPRPTARSWWR